MRELFRFLIRYHAFFLFVFLEVVSGILIIQNQNYHRSRFLHAANGVTGSVYENYSGMVNYFNLQEVNDSLLSENARLRSQLANSYTDDGIRRTVIYDSLSENFQQVFEFIEASVISNTTNATANYFFINRGTKHGIDKEMGVVTNNGIAGIVVDVSKNYSVAMSLLHQNISLSAKLKEQNANGILNWDGSDIGLVRLIDIPKSTRIDIGDEVVTNGYSNIFPADISIGHVEDFRRMEGTNFVEVDVRLNMNFNSLSYVYVVDHLRIEELNKLEEELGIE